MITSKHLKLPLIAAPMFLVSGPEIVTACCKAGIIGSFPALNQRTAEGFDEWLTLIENELKDVPNPGFAVNLIVHKTNPRLQEDLDTCIKHKVPLIITSLGAVPEIVDAVHAYGGLVYHDVINLRHANKAAEAGVDGLIAVSAGAGGHAGLLSPFALISEIRKFYDKTIILSGAMSTGRDIAAAQAAGADFAYMGTRFINTKESRAIDDYKNMIIDAAAADIVYTDKVSGVNANFLGPSIAAAGGNDESHAGKAVDFGNELLADEAKAWKDVWSAGHGVGGIDDIPNVSDLVSRLHSEYLAAIDTLAKSPYR